MTYFPSFLCIYIKELFVSVNGFNKPVPRKDRPPLPTPMEYLCLVRATLRNKKISTVVRISRQMTVYVCISPRYNSHFLDSFQGCKQIPTGVLESLEVEYKWAEKVKEDEVSEAEGSLTQ